MRIVASCILHTKQQHGSARSLKATYADQPTPFGGRTMTKLLRVDAEPGDELDAAGYTHVWTAVRCSFPHINVTVPGHEYVIYPPGADLSQDAGIALTVMPA
jgi:hypothetical protein